MVCWLILPARRLQHQCFHTQVLQSHESVWSLQNHKALWFKKHKVEKKNKPVLNLDLDLEPLGHIFELSAKKPQYLFCPLAREQSIFLFCSFTHIHETFQNLKSLSYLTLCPPSLNWAKGSKLWGNQLVDIYISTNSTLNIPCVPRKQPRSRGVKG